MRKIILTLMACALAATSCNLDDQFSATNVSDLVTNRNSRFFSDYGQEYTVVTDNTDHLWKDGERLLIYFDIVNRDYDIVLKDYSKCTISKPTPLSGEEPDLGEDPLTIDGSTLSGGYANFQFSYYREKGSDLLQDITMEYTDDSETIHLYLILHGNGKNPATTSKDNLETVTVTYCFPLVGLAPSGESRKLTLTFKTLNENNEIVAKTHNLYSDAIRF